MRPHIIVPTDRNLRFHRRMATGVVFGAVALGALAVWAFAVSRKPEGAVGLMTCMLGMAVAVVKIRGIAGTLQGQVDRLASHGRRFAPTHAGVQRMQRGALTHFHVVAARFRDDRGGEHEALSETFDYDPTVLLRDRIIAVVADPYEPELCVVASDTLPGRRRRALARDERARLGPVDPFMRLIWVVMLSALAAMLVALGWLVWNLVAGA